LAGSLSCSGALTLGRTYTLASLFDSELDAALELGHKGFSPAAGAMAGVVLEKHLAEVTATTGLLCERKTQGSPI
jgi:hypothetical protein